MVWWDPWNVTNRSNARYPLCCNYRHWIIITSDVMPKLELSATRKSTFTAPRVQICHHNRIPSRKGAARRSRNHKEKDRIMAGQNHGEEKRPQMAALLGILPAWERGSAGILPA